jgi:hypothetical protein
MSTNALEDIAGDETDSEAGNTEDQPTTGGTDGDNQAPADGAPAPAGDGAPAPEGGGDPAPAAKDEPDDWLAIRERVAKGDDKVAKRLSRYATLDDALKAGVEAQNKLGGLKPLQPLGPDSTPEEIKAYRDAYGIPETVDGYKVDLPDGLVLGEADKPIADEFLKLAHEHNIPPNAANAIIANHLKLQEDFIQRQEAADLETRQKAINTLKSSDVWGREAQLNTNLIRNMLNDAPESVREGLMAARMPDGTLVGNDVNTLQWMANLARTINPHATVVPGNAENAMSSIQSEKASLEKMMGDYNGEYWKGPKAAEHQARYLALVEAEEQIQKRE